MCKGPPHILDPVMMQKLVKPSICCCASIFGVSQNSSLQKACSEPSGNPSIGTSRPLFAGSSRYTESVMVDEATKYRRQAGIDLNGMRLSDPSREGTKRLLAFCLT